jgi:tricorn protease-like protein
VHRFPNFLPDNRHFLYSIFGGRAEHNGAYVASLDSGEARRLTHASWAAAAYADGRLLFVKDGLLMAQPFDWRTMESGEAQPIPAAEHVESFSVSQNGVLAYRAGEESAATLMFMDRTGRWIGRVENVSGVSQYSLSPDARNVAFSRHGDIYVADLTRGIVSRFTFDSGDDSFPMWSPDGRRIAFLSNRTEGSGIYQKERDSGMEMLLFKTPEDAFVQSLDAWSLDGRFITYTARDRSGKLSVWALSMAEGQKPNPVQSDFNTHQGRISPDGRWLAYVSNESGRDEIFVRQFPPSGGRWQVSAQGGTNPRWSRDGRELFYVAPDRMLMDTQFEAREKAPMLGTPRILMRVSRNAYEVAPDGRFLFLQPSEGPRLPIQIVINWSNELR